MRKKGGTKIMRNNGNDIRTKGRRTRCLKRTALDNDYDIEKLPTTKQNANKEL